MIRAALILTLSSFSLLAADADAVARIHEAARVFDEVMGTPEKGVPQELLNKSYCVGIVPSVKKAGFIVGARYGKGVIMCRGKEGQGWTGPSTIRIEGGSFGLQIGATAIDLVFLIMNDRGVDKLIQSKFTVGADATAAAGPVGRDAQAQTDAQMHAEILSYSRSRGLFAGLSLQGATLRADDADNRQIYGKNVKPAEILKGEIPAPDSAKDLLTTLSKFSSSRHP
jgi:lipid-binding SYLF domain-containing protein